MKERKFGKLVYAFYQSTTTKRHAVAVASKLRRTGYLARVTENRARNGTGSFYWVVWFRPSDKNNKRR